MFNIGDKVYYTFEKRLGTITGEKTPFRDSFQWQVKFGERDYSYIRQEHLENYNQEENPWNRLINGRLGNASDLQKHISSIRLSGRLTNIFYSMMTGTAQFYPHQFKPVLKFIESINGSLLIADEVGLGKTVEALYIWKELIARKEAKKLLIICPANLRLKWQIDSDKFFGIGAEIRNIKELYDEIVKMTLISSKNEEKVWIISLQGIRYKFASDVPEDDNSIKAQLFKFLEDDKYQDFFDLVIIDEAHYLRNSETASFKTAEFLRNKSKNMVLLSATPIQTSSDNLFNLLKLLSPEEYTDKTTFGEMLNKNINFVKLSNSIRNIKNVTDNEIEKGIKNIKSLGIEKYKNIIDFYYLNKNNLRNDVNIQVKMLNMLSNYYFYNQCFTRTRKCDTTIKTAKRIVKWEHFTLNDLENKIYKNVKNYLENIGYGRKPVEIFTLITRLRQLTSSIPAAIEYWKERGSIPESIWANIILDEENDYEEDDNGDNIPDLGNNIDNIINEINLDELIKNDTKYKKLKEVIHLIDKKEKIIIFSFYRGTVKYLNERLNNDGIKSLKLWGGDKKEKEQTLESFEDDPTIRVLVSTEVGSEGIDLQFAGYEVNYDLPWNPMRIEQRIGRIDRINQTHEKIFIYNLSCKNTIEDDVIERLYNRIDIFTSSIGDIEQIIGEKINQLSIELFNPKLTDKEREEKIKVFERWTKENEKYQKEMIKEKAGILNTDFYDAIMRNINISEENKRYITKEELHTFIINTLHNSFPQTEIRNITETSFTLSIDNKAYNDFSNFIKSNNVNNKNTIYPNREVFCNFEPKKEKEYRRKKHHDFIDSSHPLIKWLAYYENKDLNYTYSAGLHFSECENCDPGLYMFIIQEWIIEGYRKTDELHFIFYSLEKENFIIDEKAENVFMDNIFRAKKLPECILINNLSKYNIPEIKENIINKFSKCYEYFISNFEQQHKITIQQQKEYATILFNRQHLELTERLKKHEYERRKESVIKGDRTRLENITKKYNDVMQDLHDKSENIKDSRKDVAIGIIFIGEYNE